MPIVTTMSHGGSVGGGNLTSDHPPQQNQSLVKAQLRREFIKQCPILLSEDVPYDFQLEYKRKLIVDIKFDLFRLVQVNDLEKT